MLAASRRDVAIAQRAGPRRAAPIGPPRSRPARSRRLAVSPLGDRVICLRNDRRLDVMNGTIGTVERPIGNSLVVATTTTATRLLPADYLEAGHLGHGYALTVHKSQGMTVERAFVPGHRGTQPERPAMWP